MTQGQVTIWLQLREHPQAPLTAIQSGLRSPAGQWFFLACCCSALAGCTAQNKRHCAATRPSPDHRAGEFERRVAAYTAAYRPRPPGDLQAVAESMRRYQPGQTASLRTATSTTAGAPAGGTLRRGRRIWVPLQHVAGPHAPSSPRRMPPSHQCRRGPPPHRRRCCCNLANPDQLSGASTITSWRNLFMPPAERFCAPLDRKINEVLLAQELTELFAKDEILGFISTWRTSATWPTGRKPRPHLLPQVCHRADHCRATLLAGLPQQPANLDPFINLDGAKAPAHRARPHGAAACSTQRGESHLRRADRLAADPTGSRRWHRPPAISARLRGRPD